MIFPVPDDDPRQSIPEFQKHSALRGTPIWIAEAGRKYDVPQPTLTRWRKRGLIADLGTDANDSRKVLLDEGDVAYCAEIYHNRRHQGERWMFNPDGTPYIKVTLRTATRKRSKD